MSRLTWKEKYASGHLCFVKRYRYNPRYWVLFSSCHFKPDLVPAPTSGAGDSLTWRRRQKRHDPRWRKLVYDVTLLISYFLCKALRLDSCMLPASPRKFLGGPDRRGKLSKPLQTWPACWERPELPLVLTTPLSEIKGRHYWRHGRRNLFNFFRSFK